VQGHVLALVWPDQDLGRAVGASVLGLPDHSIWVLLCSAN
jgi:hypothetical protein